MPDNCTNQIHVSFEGNRYLIRRHAVLQERCVLQSIDREEVRVVNCRDCTPNNLTARDLGLTSLNVNFLEGNRRGEIIGAYKNGNVKVRLDNNRIIRSIGVDQLRVL